MTADLLKKIEEKMPELSKGQKRIAAYILEHYEKAAYLTASKMGAIVGVSESTVVRFANELGYSGYPEFQQSLQKIIRSRLTSFQRIEVTNHLMREAGVTVLEIPSAELSRGRGGPRCMSMPLVREDIIRR